MLTVCQIWAFKAGMNMDEYYSCSRKVRYNHLESAQGAAIEMNKKPTVKNKLEAYKCRFCEGWHIGRIGHYEVSI